MGASTPDVGADVRGRGRDWLAASALLIFAALRLFILEPTSISSDSMRPTLDRGDVVLVDKLSPRLGYRPDHGDLVTFTSPADSKPTLKRVVGVAGDRVRIDDGVLIVNNRKVPEPYVDQRTIDALYWGTITVPAGQAIVLGDQRAGSIDSRTYGPIPLTAIQGRALLRVWPLTRVRDR